MSVSLSTCTITFIHFVFLFNRKKTTQTHLKLTQFIFGKQTLLGYTTKQILTVAIAVCAHSQCLVKKSGGTKVPGNEKSWERKFLGTKGPWFPGNESSRERIVSGTKVPHRNYSFLGTKGLGHEKSRYPTLVMMKHRSVPDSRILPITTKQYCFLFSRRLETPSELQVCWQRTV